ncbi:MAG: RdgB/HAM1 family non-canonical purine NTP pyrophosphatase [Chitinispirillaceae bacterium]|nr:RdgB/HAM1 family non-canonical purine NTP pyrophosphatase [Chitinispirillaceae bacterium]
MARIIVASGNSGKLREIAEILRDLPYELSSLRDHFTPLPAIPETGTTFLENALQKATWVFERTGIWALADDSGLEVDALDGAPGVHSARYAGPGADAAANNRKLLTQLERVPLSGRTARFTCVVVLVSSSNAYYHATGVCEGRIIEAPRGVQGFGYDPLFVPDGYDRTFAELPADEKHHISHRGKALAQLRRFLNARDE